MVPRRARRYFKGQIMTERVDCVVIGAGVVGLACARALARSGRDVVVIERHGHFGEEVSSRNSEVIHAGIYYPTGSLKARHCVRGKALLYAFCEDFHVPYRRCGKIIVATNPVQEDVLRAYQRQAHVNGVGELRWMEQPELERVEPAVRAVSGIWSETTGIIDSHALMAALAGDLEAHGGMIAYATEAVRGRPDGALVYLETSGGDLLANWVVNAAGLHAPALARRLAPAYRRALPNAYFAKGHYYVYAGTSPFNHLIYPIAEAAGLGVHVTLDMAGQARFGPDVQWIDSPDYAFDGHDPGPFVEAIRTYFPALDETRLQAGYTGIRPKITAPGEPAADFLVLGPDEHGVRGLIHMLGIESPGLTASLALAELVASMAGPA
jgi:L-2-hydroxyglutarate oxidase LhgO